MHGPDILVRSMSVPSVGRRADGSAWQYHSRSDRHSKTACWGIVFDLLVHCPLLRNHVAEGKIFFGINHEMRDFQQDRKKNLDLVLCTRGTGKAKPETLAGKAADYGIVLAPEERAVLAGLPELRRAPVGAVVIALEAKACMTEHQKALPRLYDELNSSHLTVHGATDEAIAAAFVMINRADSFVSPGRPDSANIHRQPRATRLVRQKVQELPRRSGPGRQGYDAIAIVVVDCKNDGSPVALIRDADAPVPGESFHYDSMIHRIANLYSTRFQLL